MACLRYDPASRTFYPIKASQLHRPDTGEHLTFQQQIMRGYQRQEAKGALINGRAKGIKKIWNN